MLRRVSWLIAFACACGSPSASPDAGSDSGAIDAGPIDAGAPDAGQSCPPGPVAPAVFDCATSDPAITFGTPITANAQEWTFVPFPEAHCMDGSSTGIGVNLASGSDRVVIYLEGGGACFDLLSCATVAN